MLIGTLQARNIQNLLNLPVTYLKYINFCTICDIFFVCFNCTAYSQYLCISQNDLYRKIFYTISDTILFCFYRTTQTRISFIYSIILSQKKQFFYSI